jgi:hypothetical protein
MLGDSALCDIDRLLGLRLERSVMACKIGVVSFFFVGFPRRCGNGMQGSVLCKQEGDV